MEKSKKMCHKQISRDGKPVTCIVAEPPSLTTTISPAGNRIATGLND